ncbi:MAG: metal-sensing transcriptional repressor [Clostridia bacterium]|nr:metal-sensing transcriptional repressor [Clostridia bacterium]
MNECCNKLKHRSEAEKKGLLNRLSRIEGQLRGIKNMLNEDKYCIDILTQISAVRAALGALGEKLLEDHINTCVVNGIKKGDEQIISELTDSIKKLIK